MGLISALYHVGGKPINTDLLAAVTRAGVLLRPGCTVTKAGESVGLAVQGLSGQAWNVAGQPAVDALGERWAVLDGRVDNRAELRHDLGLTHTSLRETSDARLILSAYEAWGLDCSEKIVGDFAWIIWDRSHGRLVCARDPLGLRPLYYAFDGRTFVAASQLDQVLAALPVSRDQLNEEFIADYLVFGKSSGGATPYAPIRSLPAGHRLVIKGAECSIARYWDLMEQPKLHYSKSEQYTEHFSDLFRAAVRIHLRSDGPVWSDLSGGLDSSSIVCVAAQELSAARSAPARLATQTVVHDKARQSDERTWAGYVTHKYGLRNFQISGDRAGSFSRAIEAARLWDVPCLEIFSFPLHEQSVNLLNEHHVQVLLKGLGAELVVLGESVPPLHLADLLRQRRLRAFRGELLVWQRVLHLPFAAVLYRYALKPLLQPTKVASQASNAVPAWIEPSFARRMHLHDRAIHAWESRRARLATDQWQREQVKKLTASLHPGCFHKTCDVRLPFLHLPLLEFAMRVPWTEKVRPGANKLLLRRAMKGVLPEEIRQRSQVATGNAAMYFRVQTEWSSLWALCESSRLESLGIIERKGFERELRLARHGACRFLPGALRPLAFEAWLRARVD